MILFPMIARRCLAISHDVFDCLHCLYIHNYLHRMSIPTGRTDEGFFNLRSPISAKLCLAENTLEIVFSAEHNFCVSQIE